MNNSPKVLSELADYLVPHMIDRLGIDYASAAGGGGGSGLGSHDLGGTFHTGTLRDAQAPQFLLSTGARPLLGSMAMAGGVTIDGMDPSAHMADPDAHHRHLTALDGTVTLDDANQIIGVQEAYGFDWAAEHNFQDGLVSPHIGSIDTLYLIPTNDLVINPGNKVYLEANKQIRTIDWSPGFLGVGWGLTNTLGHGFLDIREIQVEELHAYVFIADIERVRVGETFVTQSMGILADDMVVPGIGSTTALTIEDIPQAVGAAFVNNEWILIQLIDRTPPSLVIARFWGQVNSYVNNFDGTQTYTYTHRHGTPGATLKEGSYVLSFGLSGDGYIHESVIDGAGSPYTRYATWVTDPSIEANRTVHVQIGNLDSVTDVTLNPTGWGLYADNVYLHGNLVAGNGAVHIVDAGINIQQANFSSLEISKELNWWEDVDVTTGDPTLSIYSSDIFFTNEDFNSIEVHPSSGNTTSLRLMAYRSTGGYGGYGGSITITGGNATAGTGAVGISGEIINIGSYGVAIGDGVFMTSPITVTGILSQFPSTFDIGTPGNHFATLYVDTIVAGTITGSTALGGQVWQYDSGNMFIRSTSTGSRTLFIANPSTGVMDVDIEGSLIIAGLVDGVDVAALGTSYSTHIGNANAHHSQSHLLANNIGIGGDHTVSGLTAGQVLKATSAITAQFEQIQHSEVGGSTAGDYHTQYVHNTIARTITAIHNFAPGSATAPFTLSANGQGQTIIGLKADQLNRTLSAGNGMTGGGTLTANLTLTLGTPSAVTVSSTNTVSGTTHTHAVTSASNPGATASLLSTTTSGGLVLQTLGLAGFGEVLISTSGYLNMGDNFDYTNKLGQAWIGYNGAANSAAFGHRNTFGLDGYALYQTGVGLTTINSATGYPLIFRIDNTETLFLQGDRLLPRGSGLVALGDYNRKYSEINASVLMVDNLVASNVMATIGGRILVAPTVKLTRDLTASGTTIYVDSNLAVAPQELYMAGFDGTTARTEWMRIVSGPVSLGGGEYSYVITRNIAQQGNFLIHGNHGFETGTTTSWATFMDTGASFVSFAADATSQAKGVYSGKVVVGLNPGVHYAGILTNAVLASGETYTVSYWIRTVGINGLQMDVTGPGGLDTFQANITGTTPWTRYTFEFTTLGTGTHQIRFYENSPGSGEFYVDEVIIDRKYGSNGYDWYIGDANVNLGYDRGSGFIDLTSITTSFGHYGPTMAIYAHTIDGGQPKPTGAYGNLRSYVDYSAEAMGWAVGNDLTLTPTGGFRGLTADVINGLRLFSVTYASYNGSINTFAVGPLGSMKLGTNISAAGTTAFDFNATTGVLSIGNASYPAAVTVYGSVTITGGTGYANLTDKPIDALGKLIIAPAPGSTGLFLGSTKMGYYTGSVWKTYMDNAGNFYFGGATGATIAWDGSKLYGTDGTTIQWSASSTDGKLYAGGNNIFLDDQGMTLLQGTAAQNSVSWRASSGGTRLGSISTSNSSMLLEAKPPSSGVTSNVRLLSVNAFLGTSAILDVTASGSGGETISMRGALTLTNPQAAVKGLIVNMPSGSSAVSQEWQLNATQRAYVNISSSVAQIGLNSFDNGSGGGPSLVVDRNTNASTPSAGNLRLTARGGSDVYFWPDQNGVLRMGTSVPTNANDLSGTIVGTQTSSLDYKIISPNRPDPQEAMNYLLDAAHNGLRSWKYKGGEGNQETFPNGLVTNYAPRYGMDRDVEHPHGKSLNVPVAIGDIFATIGILYDRIIDLEKQLNARHN